MLPSISPFLGFCVMHTANSRDTRARTSAHKQTIQWLCRFGSRSRERWNGDMVECERGKDTATHCGRTCVECAQSFDDFSARFRMAWVCHLIFASYARYSGARLTSCTMFTFDCNSGFITHVRRYHFCQHTKMRMRDANAPYPQRRYWRQVASNDVWEPFFPISCAISTIADHIRSAFVVAFDFNIVCQPSSTPVCWLLHLDVIVRRSRATIQHHFKSVFRFKRLPIHSILVSTLNNKERSQYAAVKRNINDFVCKFEYGWVVHPVRSRASNSPCATRSHYANQHKHVQFRQSINLLQNPTQYSDIVFYSKECVAEPISVAHNSILILIQVHGWWI